VLADFIKTRKITESVKFWDRIACQC